MVSSQVVSSCSKSLIFSLLLPRVRKPYPSPGFFVTSPWAQKIHLLMMTSPTSTFIPYRQTTLGTTICLFTCVHKSWVPTFHVMIDVAYVTRLIVISSLAMSFIDEELIPFYVIVSFMRKLNGY
jgi:hypothetical protein